MTHDGTQSFERSAILVFSTTEKVESGDLAFIKTRAKDEFAQVFFDKEDEVRLRLLNPKYPERVVKRHEVRVLCKMIGYYQDLS